MASNSLSEVSSEINIKEILFQILKKWYWYVISVCICFSLAWIYLRYEPRIYSVKASLYIREDKSKLGLEDFIDGMELLSSSKNVQNEIEIIRSFENIKQTIQEANLEVSYFIEGNIKTGELYKKSPFIVQLDTSFLQRKNIPIYVRILSDSTFQIKPFSNIENNLKEKQPIYKFGDACHSEYFSLILKKSNTFKVNTDIEYYFIINDIEQLTRAYISKLKIEPSEKKSSVLILSLNGRLPEKEIDFLDKLCNIYIRAGLEEKNQTVINTIRFIDNQLNEISDSLKGTERSLERFRNSEKVMDLSQAAEKAFTQLEVLEKEHAGLLVKHRYYHYLLDYLTYNYDIKKIIAPSAMGIEDPLLNKLISELHTLNSEKTSLEFSIKEENPTNHILKLKIENTKQALNENLKNIIAASQLALDDNESRIKQIQSIINKFPSNERNLVNIKRKFLLNETIYNYLMQKRIEAGIAKAANIPDNKIVNKTMLYGNNPVAPKRNVIIFISIILGILIPSVILYIIYILNDTVSSKKIIEQYTSIPLIGSIAHYKGKGALPIFDSPKSGVSESIRSLRVNLQYLAVDKKNKIIGVTSSVGGEGKTFFSANLAASIALSGSKVVLIGADLRKPKAHQIFSLDNSIGLSTYYIQKASIKEIIQKTSVENLDIITSGPIPPNPTELIESKKTEELIAYLKAQYEYIIIDAPPVGLVADYYLFSKYIDANLYLVRQNFTKTALLKEIQSLYTYKKLENVFIVLNDVKHEINYSYGYTYGYGYYEENNENMLQKIKQKLKGYR